MKLLKTISKLVSESKDVYEVACEKELDRLEKNYYESLKLIRLYGGLGKKDLID
jgi:ribosome-interacting GTPase 1